MLHDMMTAANQWQKLAFSGSQMMMSAGVVIQVRVMQMALGIMKPAEFNRMVMEKPSAFAKSGEMAMRALAGNKGYGAAMVEALKPIETKASANARRLSSAGLKGRKRG